MTKRAKLEDPSIRIKKSKIFLPYRQIGVVTSPIPVFLQPRGEQNFVICSVGKCIQIYDEKLRLKFCSKEIGDISFILARNNLTFVACGSEIIVLVRAKEIARYSEGLITSRIIQMALVEDFLLCLHDDNVLRVWSIMSNGTLEAFNEFSFGNKYDANFLCHPLGYHNKIVIGGTNGGFQLWNFVSKKLLFYFERPGLNVSFIKASGVVDIICVGYVNGTIELVNIKLNRVLMKFHQDSCVTGIAFKNDDQPLLATSSLDGDIAIWNLEERKLVNIMKRSHDGSVCSLEFFSGKPILMSSGSDNSIKHWIFDKLDGTCRIYRYRSGHQSPPNFIRFHDEGGQYIISAAADRTLRLNCMYRDEQNMEFSQGKANSKARALNILASDLKLPHITSFSSSSNRDKDWDSILTCHSGSNAASTWCYQNKGIGKYSFKSVDGTNVKQVVVSQCGNFGIVGSASGRIDVYNMQSGQLRRSFIDDSNKAVISGLEIDSINRYLLSSGLDGTLKRWDFKTGKMLNSLKFDYSISKIMLNRNNNLLCLACDDLILRIVDIEQMIVVREFVGHSGRITDIAISPDGRWIVSSSVDKSIRTWDVPSGYLVDMFILPKVCSSLCFSPTGDYLCTTHLNSLGIHLWTNKTLLAAVPLKPLDPEKVEFETVNLPSSGGDIEEFNDEHDKTKDDSFWYSGKDQLSPELITLTRESHAKWHNLLHLDTIKKRNKPKEPPKTQEQAPFFLTTTSSLEPKFVIPEKQIDIDQMGSKILNYQQFDGTMNEFQKLLQECSVNDDHDHYRSIINNLKNMTVSNIDLELQTFGLATDISQLKAFLKALNWALDQKKDFELIQSILSRTLKIHSDIIMNNAEEFREILKSVENSQISNWEELSGMLGKAICTLEFFMRG